MNLFQRLTGYRSDPVRAVQQLADLPDFSMMTNTYQGSDVSSIQATFQAYAEQGFQGNSTVFSLILARMMLFSEAEFKFRDRLTKRLSYSDALQILDNPWPNGTAGDLLSVMELDASIGGNSFIRHAGDQLERLRPDKTVVVSALREDGLGRQIREIIGFGYDLSYLDPDRRPAFYDVSEVAHWAPIPDPVNPVRGMSWLTPVVREIDNDAGMVAYQTKYLENAATPNILIKYSQELSKSLMQDIAMQVQAKHSGVGNAFRTMVLDRGADATVVGNSLKDMAFTDVQAAGETRIASAAGVPPIVAGLSSGLDAATYSNYGMAMRRFADITMRPNWRSACAALSKLIDVPEGNKLWFDTSDIAALRQGENEQAAMMATLASAASSFIQAGYDPESINDALSAGDINLLVHTGMVSVQLQPPGAEIPNGSAS